MSARVIVSPELCEAGPAISIKYITRILAALGAVRKKDYPALCWTAYCLNPEVALVNEARCEAAELVRPILESRHAAYATEGARAEKHDDFIQWIMDKYRANGKTIKLDETVQNIFIVMFASMHNTSFIALQSLFSLLGTPNALAEVREEIERVSENEHKATVQRYAMTPYTFKDGLQVPAGTIVSFPNLRYNTDPSIMSQAGTFDGKRWFRRRFMPGSRRFQFASTAEDAFDWGAGPHACPGRFMADVKIKLMLICLTARYDMKLAEVGAERPAESNRFLDLAPDTSMPVILRDACSSP